MDKQVLHDLLSALEKEERKTHELEYRNAHQRNYQKALMFQQQAQGLNKAIITACSFIRKLK